MTRIQRLGDVAQIVPGFAFGETFQGRTNLPTPFIKVSDFAAATNSWLSTAVNTVNREILQSLRARTYPPGTVIFPKVGGALLTNKRARLAVEATFDNNVMGLVPTDVDGDYLFYFMCSVDMSDLANTQAIPSVRGSDVACIEIPVPPFHEQRRIAAHLKTQLAAVEEARQAAQRQINEIRLLKTHALTRVLGRIANARPLGEVAKVQSGFAFKSPDFRKQGIRLLRNTNILPGRVYWDDTACLLPDAASQYSAYALSEGDVLISLDRPIISLGIKVARVALTDLPALLVQRVGRFKIDPSRINRDYLYAFIQTQSFIDAISGHDQSLGVPHISPSQIESIAIPLPSLPNQELLAKTLNSITTASHGAQLAAEAQFHDIELLPSRLIAQAFAEN
ncbi:MAG: hypothetical protein Nkreftii_000639 [Candidatus Nitrospira kreftii]|uniref:Type I restriction modification DNA specificity domain-containing protein n=1 Tax=Candidatus Nitrospira kreftii TaxID=2652173 RepID=A0A7S8IYE9_9BACT|nr:MAG: hypothetical protein Nkreftii_000639 [Candidatus Nitrospira kreftii]